MPGRMGTWKAALRAGPTAGPDAESSSTSPLAWDSPKCCGPRVTPAARNAETTYLFCHGVDEAHVEVLFGPYPWRHGGGEQGELSERGSARNQQTSIQSMGLQGPETHSQVPLAPGSGEGPRAWPSQPAPTPAAGKRAGPHLAALPSHGRYPSARSPAPRSQAGTLGLEPGLSGGKRP